jgi:phage portal protein BeeE
VFVSTYGEPNAEKVLSSFEQYCELAYGGNAAIFGLLNMQMRLFSEARLGWLDDEKNIEFTPGLEKLETPWPNGTTGELLARMRQDAAIAGNAYIRDCGYRLERLRPDWVTIISQVTTDDFGHEVREVIGYWYEPIGDTDRESAFYPVQEVAHWAPIPDPIANWRGMSWFTPALREINADRAMTEHREKFWRNSATPNIIIKYTGKISPSQKIGLAESIAAKHGGPDKAGGTLVLDEGADPMIAGSKFSDAEFSEVLAATENRMAVAAGVPALLVGLKEGLDAAAWSMYKQAIRAFADLFVRPDWRSACASLAVLVAADRPQGKRLWFDTSDIAALADGEAETATRMQTEAATIASLIQAGFEPDSAVKAVKAGDITLLKHTGLVSVQLLPPGAQEKPDADPKAEADDPAEDPPVDPKADDDSSVARALVASLTD